MVPVPASSNKLYKLLVFKEESHLKSVFAAIYIFLWKIFIVFALLSCDPLRFLNQQKLLFTTIYILNICKFHLQRQFDRTEKVSCQARGSILVLTPGDPFSMVT